ncbi:mitochondrial resolvase Ydc2 [Microdochium bolleyi]|uniref:Mitochondrial resolvase Ydc2 n=1 Tax=Microdochium bolleyi TaxID=196109 RepID=A0A136JJU5_9PEZI|nr:mitochondrial resolvase Ydc2 [Microdochium bolleyi]
MALPPGPPAVYLALRAPQLRLLLKACGLASTGNKADLVERLDKARISWQPSASKPRVLSIDMGLRNFAFALMSPARPTLAADPEKLTATADPKQRDPRPIELHAWQRRELVPAHAVPAEFTPEKMAAVALDLLKNHLLPLRPTHIILERQRARTLGGRSVLEWTLRVNMLEAMLHAVLLAMRESGQWQGTIMSIPPSRTTDFWLEMLEAQSQESTETGTCANRNRGTTSTIGKGSGEGSATRGAGDQKKETTTTGEARAPGTKGKLVSAKKTRKTPNSKKLKVAIVGDWLVRTETILAQSDDVARMQGAFLGACSTTRREKSSRSKLSTADEPALTKLDDLADSLLQGMAWLVWRENTAMLAQGRLVGIAGIDKGGESCESGSPDSRMKPATCKASRTKKAAKAIAAATETPKIPKNPDETKDQPKKCLDSFILEDVPGGSCPGPNDRTVAIETRWSVTVTSE